MQESPVVTSSLPIACSNVPAVLDATENRSISFRLGYKLVLSSHWMVRFFEGMTASASRASMYVMSALLRKRSGRSRHGVQVNPVRITVSLKRRLSRVIAGAGPFARKEPRDTFLVVVTNGEYRIMVHDKS